MPEGRLEYLLEKFFKDGCSEEEREEIALWIDALGNEGEWQDLLQKAWDHPGGGEEINASDAAQMICNIFEQEKQIVAVNIQPRRKIQGMYKLSVAAAAIIGLLIALSIIYVNKNFKPSAHPSTTDLSQVKNDISPGGNRAELILANGQKISLDSTKSGELVQMENVKVSKIDHGQLAFQLGTVGEDQTQNGSATLSWNTLRTPFGGQYQITLSDGSKAWLNAASSIKFPSVFGPGARQVETSGEVYFEIAQNAEKPFLVKIVGASGATLGKVLVLGTAFNINAYSDESTLKTTLVKGKVRVAPPQQHDNVTLSPGQQATLDAEGNIHVKENVNTDEALAWKNGLFDFEGDDIESVMRQIARWYNVDVKYENNTSAHFMGTISRGVNLSEVLKMLELTGAVHFRIEGRTITVTS